MVSEQGQLSEQENRELEESRSRVRYLIPLAEQRRFQERFNQFIRAENERLNRLIRNLYLYLQFKHYSERDLYDRICQEVAEYFRAASCELYIVRYDVEEYEAKERLSGLYSRAQNPRNGTRSLSKWLELVGAFGPARRALRQQYVTRRSRSRYEIPMVGPVDPNYVTSWTRQAFVREKPTRYTSCVEFRSVRADSSRLESPKEHALRRDVPRHVIWYQDGLYNSCRCSLATPLVREAKAGAGEHDTPYYSRVGLIKLENRTPYGAIGFSDVPSASVNQNHLFFLEEWKIVALRPYVRDLRESVKKGVNPFLPLHNNVGWQQHFEDHSLGGHYFKQLIRKLRQQRKSQDFRSFAQELPDRYMDLVHWLEKLLECLIRMESWLQHLRHACRLICGLGERPTLDRPTPMLFNVYNLRAAYNTYLFENASPSSSASKNAETPSTEPKRYAYDAVRDALLDCLARNSPDPEHSKDQLTTLESVLAAIERFIDSIDRLDQNIEGDSLPLKEAEDLIQNVSYSQREIRDRLEDLKNFLDQGRPEILERLLKDFRILEPLDVQFLSGALYEALKRTRASVDPIQMFAEQETEETIHTLCRQRANAMREALRGPTDATSDIENLLIEHALEGELPELEFEAALEEGVLADLKVMCATLENTKLKEREFEYELTREEGEVCHISKVVQGILEQNTELEDRYGVTCKLLELSEEEHDEPADIICKTARALAAATMYAGSFDQIDEKRLVFIANHIVKVLDNHMLHQARQRGLELDYDALDIFGLEHFGIELLDILHSCSQRIASAVHYLHERETYHSGEEIPQLQTHLPPLKELLEAIAKCLNGDDDSDGNEWLSCCLATITSPSAEASECILDQIYQRGTRLGLEMEPIRKSAGALCQITFRPTLGPSGEQRLAQSVLRLKGKDEGQPDGTQSVELQIFLKRRALCDRDLRALWSAVNVLEDTLKVVGATTGVTACYN